MHQLSRTDARRIAVRAQLLDRPRPTDLLEVVRGLTLLQVDATAAVAPSADLVAWSRLGSSYSPTDLADALDTRMLIDLQGMIRPREDLALYRAEMAAWRGPEPMTGWKQANRRWVEQNDSCRRDILDRLAVHGPLTAHDIPDTCAVAWRSSGWNNSRNVTMMLEQMALRGEVATVGRRGRNRLWDLAERVYPDDRVDDPEEAVRMRNELRLRSLGIARPSGPECPVEPQDVGATGEPAVIEGVKGQWRVDPSQLDQPFRGRAALLSPLDRLVFDRKRMVDLFEFDYQLEMYKPAAKRRWGYYALPILYADRLVGKVDATADRKAGVLRVHRIHQDVPFTSAMHTQIDQELTDLARWLRLELEARG